MKDKSANSYLFKSFRLDVSERRLTNGDEPLPLAPKAFDLLALLVERAGHLVEKDEIMESVWPDSFVEEGNLTRTIHVLRKILGDDQNGNKFIETVPTRGYRFVATVDPGNEVPKENGLTFSESDTQHVGQADDKIGQTIGPRSPFRHREVLLGIGLIALTSILVWYAISRAGINSATEDKVLSLAVLPFFPADPEKRDPIYEIGTADSLILRLRSAKGLVVRPLVALRAYNSDVEALTIGREQKVDYVLSSNYQIADGKIRITSQLTNVSTGSVEDTFKFDHALTGIFDIQDAVVANIGKRIIDKLGRQPTDRFTTYSPTSEDAYRLYLQGRLLTDKNTRIDAEKAVEYLEKAVSIDPNYAIAYATLGSAHGVIGMSGGTKNEQYLKQKSAVERALEIDPTLAEAYAQLGSMKTNYEWDFDGAANAFSKALELDPNSSVSHRQYAIYLNSMGRFDAAISEIKKARDLEPASVLNHRLHGMILFYARRYDEAIVQLERTVEMEPGFRGAFGFLCTSYRVKGDTDKAFGCFLRTLQNKEADSRTIESWKTVYSSSGMNGILRKHIKDAVNGDNSGKLSPWDIANLYGELGEKDLGIELIEKSLERRGWGWTLLKVNPCLDSLRSDPRFEALQAKVGLK